MNMENVVQHRQFVLQIPWKYRKVLLKQTFFLLVTTKITTSLLLVAMHTIRFNNFNWLCYDNSFCLESQICINKALALILHIWYVWYCFLHLSIQYIDEDLLWWGRRVLGEPHTVKDVIYANSFVFQSFYLTVQIDNARDTI